MGVAPSLGLWVSSLQCLAKQEEPKPPQEPKAVEAEAPTTSKAPTVKGHLRAVRAGPCFWCLVVKFFRVLTIWAVACLWLHGPLVSLFPLQSSMKLFRECLRGHNPWIGSRMRSRWWWLSIAVLQLLCAIFPMVLRGVLLALLIVYIMDCGHVWPGAFASAFNGCPATVASSGIGSRSGSPGMLCVLGTPKQIDRRASALLSAHMARSVSTLPSGAVLRTIAREIATIQCVSTSAGAFETLE